MYQEPVSIGNFSEFWFWFYIIMTPIGYSLFVLLIIWYKNRRTHFKYSKGGWEKTSWHLEIIVTTGLVLIDIINRFFHGNQYLPETSQLFQNIKKIEKFLIVGIFIIFPLIDAIKLRNKHLKEGDQS